MKGTEVATQNRAPSKPTYKDYQKFLQTYDNKSDPSTSPTPLSTNSSTSSVPSMISEADNAPVAFNEYLQSYGSKKFNTVKPNLPKKNVKTEIFIQVNDNNDKDNLLGRKYNTLRTRKPSGKIILARQNSLNKCDTLKNSMLPAGHQVSLSPPPVKQGDVPDEMIYAKTALLNELSAKPPKLNKSPSPTLKTTLDVPNLTNPSSLPPPPPPKLPDFTNYTPPITSTVKKVKPTSVPAKSSQSRPSFISEMQSKFNENSHNRLGSRMSSPGLIQNGAVTGKTSPPLTNCSLPPPPPLPKFLNQHSKPSDSVDSNTAPRVPIIEKIPSTGHSQNDSSLTGKKSPPFINSSLPPPPPKLLIQATKSLEVDPNPTTYVPVNDNTTNIDKSNPNVKKLVYNTYRGMLGAYNNKANNMVTMPKNTVVQDQGVTKQLESIELQGCLDKLNGRVNPSGENE